MSYLRIAKALCQAPVVATLLIVGAITITACSSVDCPLNNTVYTNYTLKGTVDTLKDTLTITTQRRDESDTVLLNKAVKTTAFSLPMSYGLDEDVLFFQVGKTRDTVWVKKTNDPHFESVDCGVNYFHTLLDVRHTRNAIDSIVIRHKEVNYDTQQQHFSIYFKAYRY